MDKITLREARSKGLIYYYTGKKCKNGHDSIRLVKGGACRQCKNEVQSRLRNLPDNKKKIAEYHRERHKKLYTTEKRREQYSNHLEASMFYRAKKRAKKLGIEFSIELNDIVIPEKCPVLGIEIKRKIDGKKESSPSLDRKDSTKGYTKENIAVISNRANRLKSDATLEEITLIMKYIKG